MIILINSITIDDITKESFVKDYQSLTNGITKEESMLCCLLIVKASLDNGNEDLKNALSELEEDFSSFYDKYVFTMLNKCIERITKEQINKLLNLEQIDRKLTLDEMNLIKITTEMLSMDNNPFKSEQDLIEHLEKIYDMNASSLEEKDNVNHDTSGFFDRNSKTIVCCAALLLIVLIILTCRSIFYDKQKIQRTKEE